MKNRLQALILVAGLLSTPLVNAQLASDLQVQVDAAKATLTEFGKTPAVVAALRESNTKGGLIAGMNNAKWDELADNDPAVQGIQNSAASKSLQAFAGKNTGLNKLYLRDEKGNLVAAGPGGKTLLWNVSARPFFKPVTEGKSWSDTAVKPDPTTQVKGVLFVVPVLDGSKVIGALQSNYTVK